MPPTPSKLVIAVALGLEITNGPSWTSIWPVKDGLDAAITSAEAGLFWINFETPAPIAPFITVDAGVVKLVV